MTDINLPSTPSEQNISQNVIATSLTLLSTLESLLSTSNALMISEPLRSTSSKFCTPPSSSHSSTGTDLALAVVTAPLDSPPAVDVLMNSLHFHQYNHFQKQKYKLDGKKVKNQ